MLFAIIWEQPEAKSYFIMGNGLDILTQKGLKLVKKKKKGTVNFTFTAASMLLKFSACDKLPFGNKQKREKNDF